jgi:hypothetical protein
MRLAVVYVPVLCVLFALHGARATSQTPPVVRSTYCDGQGAAERLGFDMGCPAYAIPETLNSEKIPATSCSSIIEKYPAAPDGPYWFRHPVTGAVERKWCLFGGELGPRVDNEHGRTEVTFVFPAGYNTGMTPYDFGSSVDFWRPGLSLRYLSDRGWMTQGSIATDTNPLPYWAEGALGLLTVGRGYTTVDDDVEFTADAPVVVRLYNTRDNRYWTPRPDMSSWRMRVDLEWCNAWLHCSYSNVWERYFPAGTHTLDTTYAAYQFFTPAPNTLPGSDQPADLESAAYIETPAPTVYATPTINVSIDFEVSPWHSTVMVDSRYVSTGSWAEGALGLLNVSVGIVAFTSDAPVVVRLYNMRDNRYWTPRPDMSSWRKRVDLEWCDVLVCNGPNYYYDVWERCFPAGTHTLDTTESAYQFFTPAPNTLPGSDQPAELESAAAS